MSKRKTPTTITHPKYKELCILIIIMAGYFTILKFQLEGALRENKIRR
jgi:hypothetical protein